MLLLLTHLVKNTVSHFVHEFLSPNFSLLHLILLILLLLVKHSTILIKSTSIFFSLTHIFLFLYLFLSFILLEHSLEVFTFLLSFFSLNFPFLLHFHLESIDVLFLLIKLILGFSLTSFLFISKLLISACFVFHDLLFDHILFLFFSLFKELSMLIVHLMIKIIFLVKVFFSLSFGSNLSIEFFLDKSFSLGFS